MDKEEETKNFQNVMVGAANHETVQKFGEAVKQHIVAYNGVDNETGETLKKGLKKIYNSKVHEDYKNQNLKQQAGFAAEDKYVARENAKRILNGDSTRVVRTDDIGRVNDPLFDHVFLDKNGNVIENISEQMKFVGDSPKAELDKLASPKFSKYFENDATITVPHDYYEGILTEADVKIEELNEQARALERLGKSDKLEICNEKIEKYKKIKKSLKDSGITNKEAMEARLHPKLSTAKEIGKLSHQAGKQQAGIGAAVSGCISLINNTVQVIKGDKEPGDAALDVIKDTGAGAVVGYTSAFAGSTIKGCMQNAKSSVLRDLSETNLPAQIVSTTIEITKTMGKYFNGDIDGLECLEELGEKGTSQLGAAMFATIGQAVIPVPVVGALVGSMVGYAFSSSCYQVVVTSLKEAKLAEEERIRIEKECAEIIEVIKAYQEELTNYMSNYLTDRITFFNEIIDSMDETLINQDIDGFISCSNMLQAKFGKQAQFNNFAQFDSIMNNDSQTFKI